MKLDGVLDTKLEAADAADGTHVEVGGSADVSDEAVAIVSAAAADDADAPVALDEIDETAGAAVALAVAGVSAVMTDGIGGSAGNGGRPSAEAPPPSSFL